ncbi:unnamed protein product [Cunninghamella blakesleeana]
MASSILLKKQEELNIRKVRELLRLPENKKCFDCPTKSPFFVNTTIQTFICSRCSGLVREVGHRVKSISASKFSGQEVVALELGGNGKAAKIWLNGFNSQNTPEPETDGEVRAFMRQKYYETKWFNRDLLKIQDDEIKCRIQELFTEDGLPKPATRRRNTMENSTQFKIPAPLTLSSSSNLIEPTIKTAPLMNHPQPQPKYSPEQTKRSSAVYTQQHPSPKSPSVIVSSTTSTPSLQSNYQQQQQQQQQQQRPISSTSSTLLPSPSFFSDLAGLSLSNTTTTTTTTTSYQQPSPPLNNRRATYTGGILTPNKVGSPTSPSFPSTSLSSSSSNDANQKRYSVQPTQTVSVPRMTSDSSNHKRTPSLQETTVDPYSALREHHQKQQEQEQRFTSMMLKASKIDMNSATPPSDDPYAALRQLTDPSSTPKSAFPPPSNMNTSPKPLYNSSIYPSNLNNNEISSRVSESSDGSSWQGQSFSTVNDDWVEAEPFEDNFDNNTPSPITPTASTSKPINNNNIFGDLDPLANLKKNKMFQHVK